MVHTQYFSANGLNVLGVPPLLGRVFHEADGPAGEQPQRVVVLTYRFWQRHFGGRPEAVGQINKVVAQWSIGDLNDPVVLVAVSLVLFVVTMMSAAIPANRAASIQPVDALRID